MCGCWSVGCYCPTATHDDPPTSPAGVLVRLLSCLQGWFGKRRNLLLFATWQHGGSVGVESRGEWDVCTLNTVAQPSELSLFLHGQREKCLNKYVVIGNEKYAKNAILLQSYTLRWRMKKLLYVREESRLKVSLATICIPNSQEKEHNALLNINLFTSYSHSISFPFLKTRIL